MRISGSLHLRSHRDNPSSDTDRVITRKISFSPTSRRPSHALAGCARPRSQRSARHPARIIGFGTHSFQPVQQAAQLDGMMQVGRRRRIEVISPIFS
jgi:hypothetical protein